MTGITIGRDGSSGLRKVSNEQGTNFYFLSQPS